MLQRTRSSVMLKLIGMMRRAAAEALVPRDRSVLGVPTLIDYNRLYGRMRRGGRRAAAKSVAHSPSGGLRVCSGGRPSTLIGTKEPNQRGGKPCAASVITASPSGKSRRLDARAAAVRSQNKQSVRYFQSGIFTAHPYRMST